MRRIMFVRKHPAVTCRPAGQGVEGRKARRPRDWLRGGQKGVAGGRGPQGGRGGAGAAHACPAGRHRIAQPTGAPPAWAPWGLLCSPPHQESSTLARPGLCSRSAGASLSVGRGGAARAAPPGCPSRGGLRWWGWCPSRGGLASGGGACDRGSHLLCCAVKGVHAQRVVADHDGLRAHGGKEGEGVEVRLHKKKYTRGRAG